MSETAVTATSSSSLKRRQSIDKYIDIENYLPKKKRESAIRSENNLKMLIQNGQVDTCKQKVCPKKVLSLGKEARTETLATLISAGKFDKLDKLYIRTVAAASHGSKEDVETSDSEPEILPQPKNRLESETPNKSKPTNATNFQNSANNAKPQNPTITTNLPNSTSVTKVPNPINIYNLPKSISITKVPNSVSITKVPNPISTTEVPNETNISISNKISITNMSKPEKNKRVPNTNNKETPSLLGNNKISNTRAPVDSITEVSSTNNLDQSKEKETDSDLSRSSLDAEVLALHNLIRSLASDNHDNGIENHRTVDIKHIKDIYKTVLEVKSKLNAVYKQKSIKLRKSFETIQLFVPELKRGLTLPTLQQLKEKSLMTGEEPKLLPSSHTEIPSLQQTKPVESPSPNI